MSESPKLTEILEKNKQELLAEVKKLLQEKSSSTASSNKPAESSMTSTELINLHTHTPKEMFDCPTCGGPYLAEAEKRLRPQIMKEIRQKTKTMKSPERCDDCGEVYDKKERDECPTCHESAH